MSGDVSDSTAADSDLLCVYFCDFHSTLGPRIVAQSPKEFISKELFDQCSMYIIPNEQLHRHTITYYTRLLTNDQRHQAGDSHAIHVKIINYPNRIDDRKYARNALIFSVGLVFRGHVCTHTYEFLLAKFSHWLLCVELESSQLSGTADLAAFLQPLLDRLIGGLNSARRSCTLSAQDRHNCVYLHVPHTLAQLDPLDEQTTVCDYEVPVWVGPVCATDLCAAPGADTDNAIGQLSGRGYLADSVGVVSDNNVGVASTVDGSIGVVNDNNVGVASTVCDGMGVASTVCDGMGVASTVSGNRGVASTMFNGPDVSGQWMLDRCDMLTRRLLPYIVHTSHATDTNYVARLAKSTHVQLQLVHACLTDLIRYRLVRMLPVFLYCSSYTPTARLSHLITDPCLAASAVRHCCRTQPSDCSVTDILRVYCALSHAESLADVFRRLRVRQLGINERHLVRFGLLNRLIRAVYKYPVLLSKSGPVDTRMFASTTLSQRVQSMCDGRHCTVEIAVTNRVAVAHLETVLESHANVVIVRR